MAGSEFKIISLNAHRIGRREKLVELKEKDGNRCKEIFI